MTRLRQVLAPSPQDRRSVNKALLEPLLPEEAVLGCGDPLAVADLRPGDRVLDLRSHGGIDVLLSARRVGPGPGSPMAWT